MVEFQTVTDNDLLKATLFNRSRLAPLDALAEQYGIDRSNVWAIRAGRSWKHLNRAAGLQEN